MIKLLLTHAPDALNLYYGEQALDGLRRHANVMLNPLGREMSTAEMIEAARDCQIIVSYRTAAAPREVFEQLPGLVAFSRCAIDIRNIDVEAASRAGVLVTQASAGFITSVSEWVIGAMIDLSRSISDSTHAWRSGGTPAIVMGRELKGATLGIIGFGQIARYLASLARAFGMRIVVFDPYVDERTFAQAAGQADTGAGALAHGPGAAILRTDLAGVLAQADYLVCLATATEETENLLDAEAFAQMKPGALFINPSRGNLVDEQALIAALDRGALAGCALDVGRAPDQMPTTQLARHPKVIATPHVGGLTPPAIRHQALETVEQVARIVQGMAPTGSVNADQATRLSRFAGSQPAQ